MQARIEFDLPNSDLARDIAESLELNKKINRGTVLIRAAGKHLIITVETPDLTAMRAALNTHVRLLDSLLKTWEVVEDARSKRD